MMIMLPIKKTLDHYYFGKVESEVINIWFEECVQIDLNRRVYCSRKKGSRPKQVKCTTGTCLQKQGKRTRIYLFNGHLKCPNCKSSRSGFAGGS